MELSKQAKLGKYLIFIGIFWALLPSWSALLALFSSPGAYFGHLRWGPGPLMMLPFLPIFILSIMAFLKARNNDYKGAGKFGYIAGLLLPALFLISQLPMIILFIGTVLDTTSYFFTFEILSIISIFVILLGWFSYKKKPKNNFQVLGLLLISLGFLLGFYTVCESHFVLEYDINTLLFFLTFLNFPLIAGGILSLISPEATSISKAPS